MNPFTTHGAISWPELMTEDPKSAAEFYSNVFGWNTDTMPMPTGDYTVAKIDAAGHCGIMALPEPGMPTAWVFYVTVDDVNETVKKAESLGAQTFLPPMVVPTVGTLAGIQDPQGAHIMMIQYEPMEGAPEVDFSKAFQTNGAFSWFELRTPDPDAAVEFYKSLFGWNVTTDTMGMGPYNVTKIGDVGFGGIISPPMPEAPPHWGAYVTVDDLDSTLEKVTDNGGTVTMKPYDIDKVGRFAMFQDPHGAWLAAMEYVQVESA